MATFQDKFASLPREEQARINERTQELIAEERSWRKLRAAARRSREIVGRKIGTDREQTFALQRKADLLLSSFAKQVKANGGEVRIVADFPDSPTVTFLNFDCFDDGMTDTERIRQTLGMEPNEPIPAKWIQQPPVNTDEECEQTPVSKVA